MIGCLRTRDHKQPIIALYFESETVLKFYNLEARYFTSFPFCEFYSAFNAISRNKLFAIFFQADMIFISDLVTHFRQRSEQIQMPSEIKLSERTKVYSGLIQREIISMDAAKN